MSVTTDTPGAGSPDAYHGAATAARALRAAIRSQDVDTVQTVRWLAPRPPGERDLLSDMAAAEGLSVAVRRLARFWDRATVAFEQVRDIDALEAEVYERLQLPGGVLPIVTLVRRETVASPWRVVCTTEAKGENFRIRVAVRSATLDDLAWSRRGDVPGQLLMQGLTGALMHPDAGWTLHLRGPHRPDRWPDALPRDGAWLLDLGLALSPEAGERPPQLAWLTCATHSLMQELGGLAAYLPATERLILPEELGFAARAAMEGTIHPAQAFRLWARIREVGGYVVTEGLGHLGVPEVESPVEVFATPERTRRIVARFGAALLGSSTVPSLGTEVLAGEERAVLVQGRRGARRGRSYGRFGALGMVGVNAADERDSRARMRLPDEMR